MVSLTHSFGGGALKSIHVPYFKKFSQKVSDSQFCGFASAKSAYFSRVSYVRYHCSSHFPHWCALPRLHSQRLILMSIRQQHFRGAFPAIILLPPQHFPRGVLNALVAPN